ncbi:NADPH-dependent FMN reductase [Psychroflexus lacisalsi]|uniref:NADPH-dependent FMN reductase-like domain-containing protein n=1 Tax=Psychroflexus lacisalsi TaxID=503928 RepID=A0ABP3VJS7_9FLAO|nr:NAD(P)H-dependent oxidoreductase [Psychroflexus lacisalsi]MBZ9620560.1 NAD(P)H-dependent oxidoreductase [Psychroflexus lacisalsi]
MSKIIAFTGSNSETSINDKLLKYALDCFKNRQANYIDLKPLNVPIYSESLEKTKGIPEDIKTLKSKIEDANALIVAVNEHNGTMSAFFKNITDWLSRTDSGYLKGKSILLLSTSPGQGGAQSSLEYTTNNFHKFGGQVIHQFSLPLFNKNFGENGLTPKYKAHLESLITNFENDL